MDIKLINTKKGILKGDIMRLLEKFSSETGVKIKKINVSSFYTDLAPKKGDHVVKIEIANPF